jgi:tRNA (guanine37-N1)-methyltransferase
MPDTLRPTDEKQKEEAVDMATLRVPLARSMTKLDRSIFTKTVTLSAATVSDNRNIGRYRKLLEKSRDLVNLERLDPVRPHPDQTLAAAGRKCLLLKPQIDFEGVQTCAVRNFISAM